MREKMLVCSSGDVDAVCLRRGSCTCHTRHTCHHSTATDRGGEPHEK